MKRYVQIRLNIGGRDIVMSCKREYTKEMVRALSTPADDVTHISTPCGHFEVAWFDTLKELVSA